MAFKRGDLSSAEADFLRAHALIPDKPRYFLSVEIARQYEVTRLIHQAEEARVQGRKDGAWAALGEAARLDPGNPVVAAYRNAWVTGAPGIHAKGYEPAAPIQLAAKSTRCSFHLRSDEQSLIRQVLNAYGIQPTMDASVKSRIVRFDADEVSFAEAADLAKLATDTFFVALDSQRVLVAADTKENRTRYERQAIETLYFPGLTAAELTDMQNIARNIFGADHGAVEVNQGRMILRGPEAELTVMNQACKELLTGQSELQLDIHVYEVDKTNDTNAGVTPPSSATLFNAKSEIDSIIASNSSLVQEIISSGLASAGDYTAILAILLASGELSGTVFNNAFVLFGGGLTETGAAWNSATANMLLNSSDVRSLTQTQLRVEDRQEATFRSGERYPVITSSYSALASSSSSTSSTLTVPQVQYQDLGLTLKVKPVIEGGNEVALNLDLQLASLAGSTINDIPVLSHEQYTGVVSLRLGESALVVSAMSKQDDLEITGVPGLSDIPGFSDATNRQDTTDSRELAILITPHIVRLAHPETAGPMLLLPLH
jgi:hypothetical protein